MSEHMLKGIGQQYLYKEYILFDTNIFKIATGLKSFTNEYANSYDLYNNFSLQCSIALKFYFSEGLNLFWILFDAASIMKVVYSIGNLIIIAVQAVCAFLR